MSFKFKLGSVVRKVADPNAASFRVIGLLLNGRINVRDLDNHRAEIVEGKDYEEVEKASSIPDY